MVLAGVAILVGACAEPRRATLVGLPGCGLDLPEYSAVRWVARGDFPQGAAQDEIEGGLQTLPDLPEGTAAITVEVLAGELVEAVGRTARLEDEGDVPVYFAPPDQLCAVNSSIAFREVGAIAVDSYGDVVLVGGRGQDGGLLDEVVHYRDVEDLAVQLEHGLPIASTGQSVHPIGERQFAVVGGTTPTETARLVRIDFDGGIEGDRVSDTESIHVPGQTEPPRAYHGAATMPDGRILIAGGCSSFDPAGECAPSPGCDPAKGPCPVLTSAFWIEPDEGEVHYREAPFLITPRYGADLVGARDDVVFLVGGRDMGGVPLHSVERLRPGSEWEAYGPPSPWWRDLIVGATVLEGGLVVVALSNGEIGWVSERERGLLEGWCDAGGAAPCFDQTDPPSPVMRRPLLALPGERVLADAWLLPVGLVGRTVLPADSLSERPESLTPPPGQRMAAAMTLLADGTVLLAGGREPSTLMAAIPFVLRLRPDLDGPDEEVPDVGNIDAGAFLASVPSRATVDGDALVLDAQPAAEGDGQPQIPLVRAHVRGLRSTSLHFDVSLGFGDGEEPVAHLWLSQGAVAATSVRFEKDGDQERAVFARRDPDGRVQEVDCEGRVILDEVDRPFRIDVRSDGIDIAEGSLSVRCPGPGDAPFAIGLGVSGAGSIYASDMRLTRVDD